MGKRVNRHHPRNEAFWSIVSQLLIVASFSPLVFVLWGRNAAGSFALGGVICVLPNCYLYLRVFAHFGAHAAKKIVKAFFWGEAVKLVLTASGFLGVLMLPWVRPLWVFVGYIVAQVGFSLAPVIFAYWRSRDLAR